MTDAAALNFPSPRATHRRADLIVHLLGLAMIIAAGTVLIGEAHAVDKPAMLVAIGVYVICALISNQASMAYHFSSWHGHRTLLRRIDHAAIYPSISGTFTPFFVHASTGWTNGLLVLCWALTAVAIWKKVTDENVKSRWSTFSYLALGAIGMTALPDLKDVPEATIWCVVAGAACYVVGTVFYSRKALPFRYAIWHMWVNFGGVFMFLGVWLTLRG